MCDVRGRFLTPFCPSRERPLAGFGLQVSGKIARPGEEVHIVRAAIGGIERGGYINRGIVNAVDVRPYLHGASAILALEIVGNRFERGVSGSPVVRGSQVVGMLHQRQRDDMCIAHAVPGTVIQHFLNDYEGYGKYRGSIPDLQMCFQNFAHTTPTPPFCRLTRSGRR